jgi:hypothetical protein
MTKYFRKVRNFETLSYLQEFEKDLIKEEEGDIFTLTRFERGDEDIEEEMIV